MITFFTLVMYKFHKSKDPRANGHARCKTSCESVCTCDDFTCFLRVQFITACAWSCIYLFPLLKCQRFEYVYNFEAFVIWHLFVAQWLEWFFYQKINLCRNSMSINLTFEVIILRNTGYPCVPIFLDFVTKISFAYMVGW